MNFPPIILDADFVAQDEYKSNSVQLLQIDDNNVQKNLRVFVQLGDNASFKFWIPVMTEENYTIDWTNDDIVVSIKSFFV